MPSAAASDRMLSAFDTGVVDDAQCRGGDLIGGEPCPHPDSLDKYSVRISSVAHTYIVPIEEIVMPLTIPTQRVDFLSGGIRCAAWLTLPAGPGPHPAVVLVHGFGATHDMMLAQYEQHFAARGHRDAGLRLPQYRSIRRPTAATYFDCARSAPTWQAALDLPHVAPDDRRAAGSGCGAPAWAG